MFEFKLYIAGQTTNSANAVRNVKTFLDHRLRDHYSLVIVDILEDPQMAEKDKIIISPTLVKILPLPTKRVIGDLSDEKRLADLLCLFSS